MPYSLFVGLMAAMRRAKAVTDLRLFELFRMANHANEEGVKVVLKELESERQSKI